MSEKKQRILVTSSLLFGKHGYDKTSISMICNELGINKPSLYYFFKSKEDLFLEVMIYIIEQVDYQIIFDKYNTGNLKRDLIGMGEELFQFFETNAHLTSLMYEFYIQASRNEVFNEMIVEYTKDTHLEIDKFLSQRDIEGSLKDDVTKEDFIQLLVSALFNAELSYVMKIKTDYFKVWKIIIDNFLQ